MPPLSSRNATTVSARLEDSPSGLDTYEDWYSSSDSGGEAEWDEDLAEEQKLNNHNRSLQEHFAKELGDIAETHCYRNVAVLLLSWEKTEDDVLDVSGEVSDLKKVFEDIYHFKVYQHQLVLPQDSSRAAGLQLNKYLSDFLLEEANDHTLLIVYYGGHGISNSRGRLALVGGDPHGRSKHATRVVWSKAEQQLREINADVLVVFDCCHAGALMREPMARGPRSHRTIFEYIGSSQHDMKARGPSPQSFTCAFIHALKELAAKHPKGFDTDLLLHEIRNAPLFKDLGQEPVLGGRTFKPAPRRLQLCALPSKRSKQSSKMADRERAIKADEASKYSLHLQLKLGALPTKNQISDLARKFRDLRRDTDMELNRICWTGLSSDDAKISSFPDIAWRMLYKSRRQSMLKKMKFRFPGTDINGTGDDPSRDDTPEKLFDNIVSYSTPVSLGKRPRTPSSIEDTPPSKSQRTNPNKCSPSSSTWTNNLG